ncbi:hypothetical protein HOD29_05070 [archaeon]|jgi:hypothetical protein|nr:hypothetical protein [archaeon]
MNLNFGTDFYPWLVVIKVVILLLVIYWIGRSVYSLIKLGNSPSTIWAIVLKSFLLFALTMFFFVFYGPGDVVTPTPVEEGGYYKRMIEQPSLPSPDSLKKEAEESRPYELKRQDDSGYEAEEKEADEYLKRALEKAKKLEDATKK